MPRVQRGVGVLEDHLDLAAQRLELRRRQLREVLALEDDLAGGGLVEPGDQAARGRLAAAGLADEPKGPACRIWNETPSTACTWPTVRRMMPDDFTGKYIRRSSTRRSVSDRARSGNASRSVRHPGVAALAASVIDPPRPVRGDLRQDLMLVDRLWVDQVAPLGVVHLVGPGSSSGCSVRHRSPGTLSRWTQRGWKAHPDGGFSRLGGAPGIGISFARGVALDVGHAGEQAPRVGHPRVREDFLARAVLDRAAGVHDQDVVGHLGHHTQVVGDDDDRRVELALQVLEQVEDLRLHGHVERRGGLVRNEQSGVVDQPHGDHGALPHAAGELVRVVVDTPVGLGDADPVEHLDRARLGAPLLTSLWTR